MIWLNITNTPVGEHDMKILYDLHSCMMHMQDNPVPVVPYMQGLYFNIHGLYFCTLGVDFWKLNYILI